MAENTTSDERLALALCAGDRRALGRAITLVESTRADHRTRANALLERLSPNAGKSMRVAVTGAPGVGKSTFIEALGGRAVSAGRRLAVLSVDPSSTLSGGSILGDKTRMTELAARDEVFVRPSPAGRTLGGVARYTRDVMLVCEAAGYDLVLVETVGVGQSETTVSDMTDMFLLLLLPGAGDELQGIKRGILELADLILVNKADGQLKAIADRTVADYRNAVRLLRPRSKHWSVAVQACSSLHGEGIDEAWQQIERHHQALSSSGEIERRRAEQGRTWMWSEAAASCFKLLREHPRVSREIPGIEAAVMAGEVPPGVAAAKLLDLFVKHRA